MLTPAEGSRPVSDSLEHLPWRRSTTHPFRLVDARGMPVCDVSPYLRSAAEADCLVEGIAHMVNTHGALLSACWDVLRALGPLTPTPETLAAYLRCQEAVAEATEGSPP
jgi:hypothetical protein